MNMEGFAVNMQFLWKLDKSSSAEKIDRAGTGALLTLGPKEKMGRLGEGAGRPRLELGLLTSGLEALDRGAAHASRGGRSVDVESVNARTTRLRCRGSRGAASLMVSAATAG